MIWLLIAQLSAAAAGYAIPDPTKTPGSITLYTQEQVCAIKWGTDERLVTLAMKRRVAALYGIPESEWPRYRWDHVISRSSAGADTVENLFPQPPDQSKVKDRLEVKFDKMLCTDPPQISLAEAQRALREDWRVAYEVYIGPLPPIVADGGK